MGKTFILGTLFTVEDRSPIAGLVSAFEATGKCIRKEAFKNGKDIARICYLTGDIAWVYSTSAATRCGDEEPGRDYISIKKNESALKQIRKFAIRI